MSSFILLINVGVGSLSICLLKRPSWSCLQVSFIYVILCYIIILYYYVPSYIKDTTDFLNKLSRFDNLPDNTILVTLDVTVL